MYMKNLWPRPWRATLVLLAVQFSLAAGLEFLPAPPASASFPVAPLIMAFLARKSLFNRFAITFGGNKYTIVSGYFCETLPARADGQTERTQMVLERSFRRLVDLERAANVPNFGTLVIWIHQSDQVEIEEKNGINELKTRHPFMTFLSRDDGRGYPADIELKADDYNPAMGKYDLRKDRIYRISLVSMGIGPHYLTFADMDMKKFPGIGSRGGRDRIPQEIMFLVDPTDPDSIGGKAVPVNASQAAPVQPSGPSVPTVPSAPPAPVPEEPVCTDVIDNRLGQSITLFFNGQAPTLVPPGVSTLQLPCPPEGIKITANLAALRLPSTHKVVVSFLDGKEGAAELGANPGDRGELFLPTGSGKPLRTRVLSIKPRG